MKDAAITYGGLCVPQGQTKRGNAPILDTGYSMPITVVNGAFDGPTVLITSGIHGGEYPGIQTAIELSNELDAAKIHGQVILIHPVNTQPGSPTACPKTGKISTAYSPAERMVLWQNRRLMWSLKSFSPGRIIIWTFTAEICMSSYPTTSTIRM